MDPKEIIAKVKKEPDFVALKRFDYSLNKALERYPNGCPPHIIATALCLTEDDLIALYTKMIGRLKKWLKVDHEKNV